MCEVTTSPASQLSIWRIIHLNRSNTICLWPWIPKSQLSTRPSSHLDSRLTRCPWTWRTTMQFSIRPSRQLGSRVTMYLWTWRPIEQFCNMPNRHPYTRLTMCPPNWTSKNSSLVNQASTWTAGSPCALIPRDQKLSSALGQGDTLMGGGHHVPLDLETNI